MNKHYSIDIHIVINAVRDIDTTTHAVLEYTFTLWPNKVTQIFNSNL